MDTRKGTPLCLLLDVCLVLGLLHLLATVSCHKHHHQTDWGLHLINYDHSGSGSGSSTECPDCDCEEYTLVKTLSNRSMCVDENAVFSVLKFLDDKSQKCRKRVIDELAKTYENERDTPSFCQCSGHNTFHQVHDYGVVICYHDRHFLRMFNQYFYHLGEPYQPTNCRSHHSLWRALSQISDHDQSKCQKLLVQKLGEIFTTQDECSCVNVNIQHSSTTAPQALATETKPAVSATTSTKQTPTVTLQQSSATMTRNPTITPKPVASATTSTKQPPISSATQKVAVKWTCGKLSTVESIAIQTHLNHGNTTTCAPGNRNGSDEAFVLINCNAPSPILWQQGINVMQHCNDIPTYTPVATFIGGTYYPSLAESGIFIGCVENGFKLGVQHCNDMPTIDHVLVTAPGL